MYKVLVILIGKSIIAGLHLLGRNGSALPGLVVEKLSPSFTAKTLAKLPDGVAVISGTNGKTTTTKITTELLQSTGKQVFTNPTGSNFGRGVTAALLKNSRWNGKLAADIAVLELDEAHAVHFVKKVKPKFSLLLNVMHDQLDRFNGPEHTAELLQHITNTTTDTVVLNQDDEYLQKLNIAAQVVNFGSTPKADKANLVTLLSFEESIAKFQINNQVLEAKLKLSGHYNAQNAAAALALVKTISPGANNQKLVAALTAVEPAFGRGEKITVNQQTIELVLVKNTDGFQSALQSFAPNGVSTMVTINDNYADGRDISWLKTVNFDSLQDHGVAVVSGLRAAEASQLLTQAGVPVGATEPNLAAGLSKLLATNPGQSKRIYCSYTAMVELRRLLIKQKN